MKGKKITLPGISPIPWEPCTLFSNGKGDISPGKDREETEAISNAKRASNSKYKTQPCKWFHSGLGCERGDNCDYIHDFNFKGVMPPPHTYKHKKSHMMGSRQHNTNQAGAVTSSQGNSSIPHQTGSHQPQGHQKGPASSNNKFIAAEGGHMTTSSLSPSLRAYGGRTPGDKDYRQSKADSYRYRGYMADDYRRQQFGYRGEDDDGDKHRYYDDERRSVKNRGSEDHDDDEEREGEEEQEKEEEEEDKSEEQKEQPMDQEDVSKADPDEAANQEEGESKQAADTEEGQVQSEYPGKYYNNYNQRMRRNFDNREYYNTNYRRDYHHKRGFSDPYYEDYDNDTEYGEQGYNGYYNERGYYGNNYYYGRNRNYRQGYYDQSWGRGKGGWRSNGYRYDDYEDDYYDEDNQTAQAQTSHLPGNPYEEEGQEEMEMNSDREEGEVREEGQDDQQDEEAEGQEYPDAEDEPDQRDNDQEALEEGQIPANEILARVEVSPKAKSTEQGSGANDAQSEDKSGKADGKDDDEDVPNKKGRNKRDFQKRERGEREDFRRGDRGDRYNNTGRYGPFGGKGRNNRNFNYNQGIFGPQGENIPMQMMYNMPFMNMMNNSFDLNTMMHFANNFQNYQNTQQGPHENEKSRGSSNDNYNGHQAGRKAAYHNQRNHGHSEVKSAPYEHENQEEALKDALEVSQLPKTEQSRDENPQIEKQSSEVTEKKNQSSNILNDEPQNKSPQAKDKPIPKHQAINHKKDSDRNRQNEERMDEEGEDDEEEGNDYGEEEQKDDEKNDHSYQDEHNDDENYDEQGYLQYNDYRYRNNRDYDHRSAHYHQQQRMKFFNQQFIETLKKYPPDVFKCTFPQFFGMSGGNSTSQSSQQTPSNFNNMSGINFMSYMMNQMMNQNTPNITGPSQNYQGQYYGGGGSYPTLPSASNAGQLLLDSTGMVHPEQVMPSSEEQGIPSLPNVLKSQEGYHLDQEAFKDPAQYQNINLQAYEPSQGQSGGPIPNLPYTMSQQQNLFADIMSMHQGFQRGGLQNYPPGPSMPAGPISQQSIEQDFHIKDATSNMTIQIPVLHGDQRIDINAMLHEDNHVRNMPSDSLPIGHQNDNYGGSSEKHVEDRRHSNYHSSNTRDQNKQTSRVLTYDQPFQAEPRIEGRLQFSPQQPPQPNSDRHPEPMMREPLPNLPPAVLEPPTTPPKHAPQDNAQQITPQSDIRGESESKPALRRSTRKRGKK